MGLICIKGCLLTQATTYPWLKWVTIGRNVILKSLELSLINFCNLNIVYMLFCNYKRSARWKHLRGIVLFPMDAAGWMSWVEGIDIPYSTYCYSLLLHFYFSDSLAFVSSWFLCLLILIVFYLFWTIIWNRQWRWSLYIHILCGLLLCGSGLICKCFCLYHWTPLH